MRKVFISAFLIICMCFHMTVLADRMDMNMTQTESGGVYSVKLSVTGNSGLCAGSFEIVYDGASFELSNLKGSAVFDGAMLELNENYSKNAAKVSFISMTPISGDGEIISFDIMPKLPNVTTDISIQKLMLADIEENVLDCSVNTLTIGKKTTTSGSSRPSGGGGSIKPIAPVPAPVPEVTKEQEQEYVPKSYFSDIDSYEWAKKQILFLADNKIVNGIGNDMYAPASPVKRGDFICMLMRMLTPEKAPCEDFADVNKDEYWYESIMIAKGAGIAQGYDNHFNPNANITRQDMFSLVCRACKFEAENADKTYFDSDLISDYAKESIRIMSALGFIEGNGGYINPLSNATRAETAVLLYNIYISKLKEE